MRVPEGSWETGREVCVNASWRCSEFRAGSAGAEPNTLVVIDGELYRKTKTTFPRRKREELRVVSH